jgi:cell division septum initiation protein DivIVA
VSVALERQSIEKKDFPIGRRGYDPDAVDTHLSGIAEEVDELKRASRRRSETLAGTASEQVRAIVEAAENSAVEIQRQAEEDARDIRAEASGEAQSTREQATDQARQYVGRVSESTAVMLQRLDAMESELSALLESLRTGSNRLNADLQLLEGNLTEVSEAVAPRPRFEREPEGAAVSSESELPDVAEVVEVEVAELDLEEPPPDYSESAAVEEPDEVAVAAAQPAGEDGADDTEGARLIALNMALNGTPREETDRYLAENFRLTDRAGLLDEVYASVEG